MSDRQRPKGAIEATPARVDPARLAVRADREFAEFLPAAVEISVRPVPHVVPVLIGVVIAAVAVAGAWASFARLDVFTFAAGRVRSTVAPAVVQPLEAGRVIALRVANGDKVASGDTLVVLDDVAVNTALQAAISGRASWLAEVERRAAAYGSLAKGDRTLPVVRFSPEVPAPVIRRESEALETEYQALMTTLSANAASRDEAEARRQRFVGVKATRQKLVEVLTERVGMAEALLTTSAGSKAAVLTAIEARVRAEVDLADTSFQLAEIEASIRNLKEQEAQAIANYLANQSKGIQAAERQIEQLDQEILKDKDRLDHLALRAPTAGTVQQLAVTSVGQVVTPGQALAVIVPDRSELVVEALVPSAEIGFVREGDAATVKADAFPFTRYGTFAGVVASLSSEAVTLKDAQGLQDPVSTAAGQGASAPSGVPTVNGLYFVARVRLEKPELQVGNRTLRLEPGMTARVEIKTESRRVIDYVLSPVAQVLDEAGHER